MKKAKSRIYQIKNSNNNYNINQSISELHNRKTLTKKTPYFKKKNIILNSQNNNQNNLDKIINNDKSHDVRIENLLNNTKNFFTNLGYYLEINKPEEIPYYNASKIYKGLSKIKMKDIQFPKTRKNQEGNINKLYGRMFSYKILNDDNKNNDKSNKIIKEIINTQSKEDKVKDINYEQADNKIYNSKKNIETNNNQINNNINYNVSEMINTNRVHSREKNYNSKNEILPIIKINKYTSIAENNKVRKNNKNNVKIAEIREIYPCYPYNRIININNSTKTFNNKKYNKFCFDLKNNYVPDSRYYYEKIMDGIKCGNIDFNQRYIYNKTIKRKSNSCQKVNNVFI